MPVVAKGPTESSHDDTSPPDKVKDSASQLSTKPANLRTSSKKFKIESVDVKEDPLYNDVSKSNGQSNNGQIPEVHVSPCSPLPDKPEFFQSIEDMSSKPRSQSVLSSSGGSHQKFFSVEELSEPIKTTAGDKAQKDLNKLENKRDTTTKDWLKPESKARAGGLPPVSYSKPIQRARNGFDDSFKDRASITPARGDDSVVDIAFAVPDATEVCEQDVTITSAYEQNMSINKLLMERHKTSLATVGRVFGRKQKEAEEAQRAAAVVLLQVPKKKNNCLHHVTCIRVWLAITFCIIVAATAVTLILYSSSQTIVAAEKGYIFDYKSRELSLYRNNYDLTLLLKGHLGEHVGGGSPYNCSAPLEPGESIHSCFKWNNKTSLYLNVTLNERLHNDRMCLDVHWVTSSFEPMLMDCYNISGNNNQWYGGFYKNNAWPLSSTDIDKASYLPGKPFGNIAERYWISTSGCAIIASKDIPLHVSIKNDKLCLSSWYGYNEGNRYLNYSLCYGQDTKDIHHVIMNKYYKWEEWLAPPTRFDNPLFTSNDSISHLNRLIGDHFGSNYSYIVLKNPSTEIDNHTNYNLGAVLSPYVPVTDPEFQARVDSDIWMKSPFDNTPALYSTTNVTCALLNMSNYNTLDYLTSTLPSVDTLLLASDGQSSEIHGQELYPISEISSTFQSHIRNYLTKLSNVTDKPVVTTVAAGTQHLGAVYKLPPMNNLREAVGEILVASLMGYHHINPGEIGGLGMSANHLLRSMQIAVFMPVVQFSEHIWQYNNSTLKQVRKWLNVRQGLLPTINEHISEHGYRPLYTPIWWDHPLSANDEELSVNDQFMFNGHMVAPIVDPTKNWRMVYFPDNIWIRGPGLNIDTKTNWNHDIGYKGPGWKNVSAHINDVLFFSKLS